MNISHTFLPMVALLSFVAFTSGCSRKSEFGPPLENIYRVPIKGKFVSLDPHNVSDAYSAQVQSLTYESLYQNHFLKRPYVLIPALAEKMPEVSKDGKTWVFHLKKGILFQDDPCFSATSGKGRELVAQDYDYYFRRIANMKFGSPIYSEIEPLIEGLKEYKSGKAKDISGVKVLDKYTFEVHLLKKSPRFIYSFSGFKGATVPEECDKYYGEKIGEHSIGTGPFMITKYSRERATAVRNPNFRKEFYPDDGSPQDKEMGLLEDAGKQVPFVDKVELEVVEEDQPRWLKFRAGEFSQSGVPKDSMDVAFPNGELNPELKALGVQAFRQVMADVITQFFNMEDPVWGKHKELRQAFALARDIEQYNKILYSGFALPAQSMIVPNMYGYDPQYRNHLSTRNLEKAKQLLVKAGYPEGKGLPPLVLPNSASTAIRQGVELMQRQMKEIGIEIKYEPMGWPELMKRFQEKKFTLGFIGNVSDMPDPENALPVLHSRAFPPNGQNYGRYNNPKYDKLIEEIEVLDNGPERLAKVREALKILEEDAPLLPMSHRIMNQLYQPWIKNASAADELYMIPWLKYRRVVTRTQSK